MPYTPEDTEAQNADTFDISDSDATELHGKLGGLGFPAGLIVPPTINTSGSPFAFWIDNGTLYCRLGGTTYSVALSQVDAWTIGMINSLYEQWAKFYRTN